MRHKVRGRTPRDRGAIAILIAVLAGSGAFVALLALSIDIGRLYLAKQQVRSAADSAVEAIAWQCMNQRAACDSVQNVAAFASVSISPNLGKVTGICLHPSDAAPAAPSCKNFVDSSTVVNTAICPALKDGSGNVISETGDYPYIRLIVSGKTPFTAIFASTASKTFTFCDQVTWHRKSLTSINILLPLIFPGCMNTPGDSGAYWGTYDYKLIQDVETPTFMVVEDNGGNTNKVSTQNCTVRWDKDYATPGWPHTQTVVNGLSSIGTLAWVTAADCGGQSAVGLLETRTIGTKLGSTCKDSGAGRNQVLGYTNLVTGFDAWVANAAGRMVALAGPVTGNSSAPVTTIIGFAEYHMVDYYIGGVWDNAAAGTGDWDPKKNKEVNLGSHPRDPAGRSWVTADASNSCTDSAHVCIWGYFKGRATFPGNSSLNTNISINSINF